MKLFKKSINKSNVLIFIFFISYIFCIVKPNAISYTVTRGRFGDHILAYAKAQWLAHYHQLPLWYVPFEYSEQLGMHTYENNNVTIDMIKVDVTKETELCSNQTDNILYRINLGTCHGKILSIDSVYECSRLDTFFRKKLQKMLTPIIPINQLLIPKDKITVALHIRKGSGCDKPLHSQQLYDINEINTPLLFTHYDKKKSNYADQNWPHKFPPDQYYMDQLIFLSELLDDQPLYVYIFTDDKNPLSLMQRYQQLINKPNIQFDCRNEKNQHDVCILDDYWNMTQFDCLIRASSNFSRAAQLLGNHAIVIFPKHAGWIDDKVVVDTVGIALYNKKKKDLAIETINIFLKKESKKYYALLNKLHKKAKFFSNNLPLNQATGFYEKKRRTLPMMD